MLATYPELELIVADDGLQHYALQRDMELQYFLQQILDAPILDLLPNGSLREPLSRLASVDAVVVSGGKADTAFRPSENMFASHIETGKIYRLNGPSEKLDLAGFGESNRRRRRRYRQAGAFFNTLQSMNIALKQTVALPDHADITAADLPDADVVIMTERMRSNFQTATA